MAWASCHGLGADDWVVVAQQSDEPARDFTERVRLRARRLRKEDAQIEAVDVYTAPHSDAPRSLARRVAIEALGDQITDGGRLTLWSDSAVDSENDAELSAILAQFGPILAERQIAMNHQACDPEERSGVRHAIPKPSATGFDPLADFDDLG
ncbi:MAG TPA: hypothetical protein VK745_00745 [Polyangiaceae bacterium]|jgi:hypothetical protein|nr:hypothetical protein [Polyangiaceae bacterium]